MPEAQPYEEVLQGYLRNELRVLNAHLPGHPKLLADLLREEHPHVVCRDGSAHLFKRKELEYLASLTDTDEQGELLLPLLIELKPDRGEVMILSGGGVVEKIISRILDMPLTRRQEKFVIYKPQLAVLRKILKTTTQYVFSPGVTG